MRGAGHVLRRPKGRVPVVIWTRGVSGRQNRLERDKGGGGVNRTSWGRPRLRVRCEAIFDRKKR